MNRLSGRTAFLGLACGAIALLASFLLFLPITGPPNILLVALAAFGGCGLGVEIGLFFDVLAGGRGPRCPNCGYDLRGNSNGIAGCPECGWNRPQVQPESEHPDDETPSA